METFGVVAGGHQKRGGGVGPDAEAGHQVGSDGQQEGLDLLIELGQFSVQRLDSVASEDSDALVAAVTGSADLVARSLALSVTSALTVRPFSRECSWSGAVKPR